eukprot:1037683-Pelagomonas_calceolata.AAC.4
MMTEHVLYEILEHRVSDPWLRHKPDPAMQEHPNDSEDSKCKPQLFPPCTWACMAAGKDTAP